MSTPILTTPEQHELIDPTVERNPRRLQRWLSDLPLMNVVESVRLVVNALEPLNEQRVPHQERLELLDEYRGTARKLFMTSGPAGLRQLPAGKAERRYVVDGLERLCLALAGGYKVVVKALYRDAKTHKALFLRSLQGAVEQLGFALAHSYRFHRPVPPLVFLELHQLYLLARYHGLLNEPADASGVTLSGHYQAALLLALCDPFHLPDGIADQYHRSLLRYAGLARIVPGNQWPDDGEGRCVLDLRGDSPPRLCVRLSSPVEGDEPYLLDMRPALQAMHHQLGTLPGEQRAQTPEAALLRALLPEVARGDLRKDVRRADGRWLEVVLGLEGVHDYLAQRTNTAPTRRVGSSGELVSGAEPRPLRVVDSSDSGLRLSWEGSGVGEIAVGEILGIVSDTEELLPRMQLAVVRWVRSERSGSTDLGLELIAGRASAVNCRPADDPAAPVLHCLFLPSAAIPGSAAGLIAPKELYHPDRRLLLYVGRREVPVRAARRMLETACVDRFEFAADAGL